MKLLVDSFGRYGVWVYLLGSLLLFFSSAFFEDWVGYALLIPGILLTIADPTVHFLGLRQKILEEIEKGLLITWILGAVAIITFFARLLIEVPTETLGGPDASIYARIRFALLFIFLLSYGASLVYRLMISLSFAFKVSAHSDLAEHKEGYLKRAAYSIFAVIPLLVLVNYISHIRNPVLDFTPGYYSFGSEARQIMGSVSQNVSVYVFLPEAQAVQARSNRVVRPELFRIAPQVRVMLEQLPLINSYIDVQFLNADLESYDANEFGTVNNGTIVIRRLKDEIQDIATEKAYVERRVNVFSERDLDRLERELTRALVFVSQPRKTVYFAAANGERYIYIRQQSKAAGIDSLKEQLRFYNMTVKGLDDADEWPGQVPEDSDALFLIGPTVPYGKPAKDAIIDYIKGGGKVFATIDPAGQEDLTWLLKELGGAPYRFEKGVLTNTRFSGVSVANRITSRHPILESMRERAQVALALPQMGYFSRVENDSGRDLTEEEDTEESPEEKSDRVESLEELVPETIVQSAHNAYVDANRNGSRDAGETGGRKVLGLAFKKPFGTRGPKIAIYSGTEWLTQRGLAFPIDHQNLVLAADTFFWMIESPLASGLVTEKRESRSIQVTEGMKWRLILIGVILFPVGTGLALGFSIVYYRRRRRFVGEE